MHSHVLKTSIFSRSPRGKCGAAYSELFRDGKSMTACLIDQSMDPAAVNWCESNTLNFVRFGCTRWHHITCVPLRPAHQHSHFRRIVVSSQTPECVSHFCGAAPSDSRNKCWAPFHPIPLRRTLTFRKVIVLCWASKNKLKNCPHKLMSCGPGTPPHVPETSVTHM